MSSQETPKSDRPLSRVPEEGYEHLRDTSNGFGQVPLITGDSSELEVLCGPLLNYKGLANDNSEYPTWTGTVLVVTKPKQRQPIIQLRQAGRISDTAAVDGDAGSGNFLNTINGVKLYTDLSKEFWRFSIEVPLQDDEAKWEYSIPRLQYVEHEWSPRTWNFVVPSAKASMRMMSCSCNGFSIGTDRSIWTGLQMWDEVMRIHAQRPFHVMIGGGDQIYNDSVRVDGPLKEWTDISSPKKRRDHPFDQQMRARCDDYYFNNYKVWYRVPEFAIANSQIPQINIWDDHDIIDGFGSYHDHFMKCHVFRGIGGISYKYYCLFQHHIPPPVSTYTSDVPETMSATPEGTCGADPEQLKDSWVLKEPEHPSWILGRKPGPYIAEPSRSVYMRLGRHIAFLGIDARTERTRHEVNYPDTYDEILKRTAHEIAASDGQIRHLVLLLGIPIAYPRLAWLESIFASPAMGYLRKASSFFCGDSGTFFNSFDGQVDLLDDLDDHYTARHHKQERRNLILSLQALSKKFSVRTTILGGDVHLAAIGRFYSKTNLNVQPDRDFRYQANIISSAITNKPPPKAVANLLAKRNIIHHLDHSTDETLVYLFDKQPGGKDKGGAGNKATMPSRNFACLTEVEDDDGDNEQHRDVTADGPGGNDPESAAFEPPSIRGYTPAEPPTDGHDFLNSGEDNAGTQHPAADGIFGRSLTKGGLDVSIRVEIDPTDPSGATAGYGFSGMF